MINSKASDIARFLGATIIFYHHFAIRMGFPLAEIGPPALTFFISMAGTAYVCFSNSRAAAAQSLPKYLLARVAAIFPAFAVINLALFALSYVYPSTSGRPFTVVEFLCSTAGISQYIGLRYLSTVMWFVPFIIQAYVLFPFIDRLLNKVSALAVITGAFAITLLLDTAVARFIHDSDFAVGICRNWSPLFWLPEVCIGVIIGRAVVSDRDQRGAFLAIGAFGVISLLLAATGPYWSNIAPIVINRPLLGFIVTGLILAVANLLSRIPALANREKLLRLVGTASYPFYLAHGVAIAAIHKRFGVQVAPILAYYALCWGGSILLTIALGRVMKRFGKPTRPKAPMPPEMANS